MSTATLADTKECSRCWLDLPLRRFSKGSGRYGLKSICKRCAALDYRKDAGPILDSDDDREPEYDPAEIEARIAEIRAEKAARGELPERRRCRDAIPPPAEAGRARYRGVSFGGRDCPSKPWRAVIDVRGRRVSLGYHATPEEAALAYDAAARAEGRTGNLNFPEA